jgi:WD40 repeat protein
VAAVDGDRPLAPAEPTGHLTVWRTDSGSSLARPFYLYTDGWTVAFSPDGKTLVAGAGDGSVRVFDARTVHLERTLHPIGEPNTSLAFAPDGTLVTGSWSGIVQRWDVSQGKQLGRALLAMPSPVSTISFDPTGEELATGGGSDGFVKLWDARTLQQLGSTFPGEPGKWASALFTPDGAELVTLYANGRGTVWPATLRAWEDHACSVAGRNFNREEWSRFVGGRSYKRVCR